MYSTKSFFVLVIKISSVIEGIGWLLMIFGGKGSKDSALYMIIGGIVGIVVSYILYANVGDGTRSR